MLQAAVASESCWRRSAGANIHGRVRSGEWQEWVEIRRFRWCEVDIPPACVVGTGWDAGRCWWDPRCRTGWRSTSSPRQSVEGRAAAERVSSLGALPSRVFLEKRETGSAVTAQGTLGEFENLPTRLQFSVKDEHSQDEIQRGGCWPEVCRRVAAVPEPRRALRRRPLGRSSHRWRPQCLLPLAGTFLFFCVFFPSQRYV